MEAAGIFIGFRYFLYLRKKQTDPIGKSDRTWILIGAIFGAVLGSRVVGSLEDPAALLASANPLLYVYSNKTILGGLLGGLMGVELVKKKIGVIISSGDLFTYPLILAMIIGRIGCFSMGIYENTYGLPTSWPTGMNLGDGIARHPVNLYEIVFLGAVWCLIVLAAKNYRLADGSRFKLFMIAYIFFRFLLDFIKPHADLAMGLSTIQFTCLLGMVYYSPFICKPGKLLHSYA